MAALAEFMLSKVRKRTDSGDGLYSTIFMQLWGSAANKQILIYCHNCWNTSKSCPLNPKRMKAKRSRLEEDFEDHLKSPFPWAELTRAGIQLINKQHAREGKGCSEGRGGPKQGLAFERSTRKEKEK